MTPGRKTMSPRISKSLAACTLALILAAGTAPGLAQDYRGGIVTEKGSDMLLDALVVRPVMLATTIVGAGLFVASMPFTVPSNSLEAAGREFFYKPGEYTFARPLGNWHQCGKDLHPC
jgi:hypothetical protein